MSLVKLSPEVMQSVRRHLFERPAEHFVFLLAKVFTTSDGPLFLVEDLMVVPDEAVHRGHDGYSVDVAGLLPAINEAAKRGLALVEGHNHGGDHPRFSRTDQRGFEDFVPYVLDSLPGRPYGATVWAGPHVYGEYFEAGGGRGVIRSVLSQGVGVEQIISSDRRMDLPRYSRQEPWFTAAGQLALSNLRVAVVGLGGTGSHIAQQLAYLGIRDFVLVDGDRASLSNLNRNVMMIAADEGGAKAFIIQRAIRQIAPDATVTVLRQPLPAAESLQKLKGVDVLFGCVDNDGARLVMNELAVAYEIPYFDLATGLVADDGHVEAGGGRVSYVGPTGPCLNCAGEIDPHEARYFLAPEHERQEARRAGYVEGLDVPAPAVVSVNGVVAATAVNEFAMLASGARPVPNKIEFDLVGSSRPGPGSQWLGPVNVAPRDGCVECAKRRQGDETDIERFARSLQVRLVSS